MASGGILFVVLQKHLINALVFLKKTYSWASHFHLEKSSIWAGYMARARRATARPVNTLLSSEQQRNHRQEKLCSAHASKTQILLELLGPSCRPHLVQFSHLLTK